METGLHNKMLFFLFTIHSFRPFVTTNQYFEDTMFTGFIQTRRIKQKLDMRELICGKNWWGVSC